MVFIAVFILFPIMLLLFIVLEVLFNLLLKVIGTNKFDMFIEKIMKL